MKRPSCNGIYAQEDLGGVDDFRLIYVTGLKKKNGKTVFWLESDYPNCRCTEECRPDEYPNKCKRLRYFIVRRDS